MSQYYSQIVAYATANSIRLDQGYRVWVLAQEIVIPCSEPDGPAVFAELQSAILFAQRHPQQTRVVVTGPANGQFIELGTKDRLL